ncbi:Hypothetical protein KVN_LOCUS483 [uncultured virus]|nr:Hypothetical protein KVN_LOCUS483 [uncultured virus]
MELKNDITNFYNNLDFINANKIFMINTGKSKISLRILDNFLEVYCKNSSNNKMNNIYEEYKTQILIHNGKQYFDPFRRKHKLNLYISVLDENIETSIGQLNFFMWLISNNILEYVEDNIKKYLK